MRYDKNWYNGLLYLRGKGTLLVTRKNWPALVEYFRTYRLETYGYPLPVIGSKIDFQDVVDQVIETTISLEKEVLLQLPGATVYLAPPWEIHRQTGKCPTNPLAPPAECPCDEPNCGYSEDEIIMAIDGIDDEEDED